MYDARSPAGRTSSLLDQWVFSGYQGLYSLRSPLLDDIHVYFQIASMHNLTAVSPVDQRKSQVLALSLHFSQIPTRA